MDSEERKGPDAVMEQLNVLAARVVALTAENKLLKTQIARSMELPLQSPTLDHISGKLDAVEATFGYKANDLAYGGSTIVLTGPQQAAVLARISEYKASKAAEVAALQRENQALREENMLLVTRVEEMQHHEEALSSASVAFALERELNARLSAERRAGEVREEELRGEVRRGEERAEELKFAVEERRELERNAALQQAEIDRLVVLVEMLRTRLAVANAAR